ncbi:hypothetical protein DBV15_08838 [Temnothorax longispinosus]|uniref:Uncharacterized protein n=1 Tax=Temnothorax longispinosus TaxID=300112 RepID=A0A4V6RG19_9HYME|nr:hypothetical protein DBV15_08838 [Temnothorax longispinosus]
MRDTIVDGRNGDNRGIWKQNDDVLKPGMCFFGQVTVVYDNIKKVSRYKIPFLDRELFGQLKERNQWVQSSLALLKAVAALTGPAPKVDHNGSKYSRRTVTPKRSSSTWTHQ